MRKQSSQTGNHAATDTHSVPPIVHDVLDGGGGQPLDATTRAFMEPRFGHDFSKVRVHIDQRAVESARAVNALAYTAGRDVVFGPGQYALGTGGGRRLLAHELTHVVQQSGLDGIRVDKTNAGRSLSPIASEIEVDKVADVITDTEKLDHGTKHLLSMQQSVRFGTLQRTPVASGTSDKIAALEDEKTRLEAITKEGSGKTFGEVASAFAKLKDVTHDLAILKTGTGVFVGSKCPVKPAGARAVGCTSIVLIVLEEAFKQQGRSADWAKVDKKIKENTLSHAKNVSDIEGEDIQAALQSEAGWKGIFWASDPAYRIPEEHLKGAGSDEARYAFGRAKSKHIYQEKGKPGLSIHHLVTNYAPEAPKAGYGEASKTKKDTTQLDKLKKLPFGVLSAHEAYHMAFITYGKVVEVHWRKEATDVDLIEQTDLEKWWIGPQSGYHLFASGAIIAPAADVDAAFK